MIVLFKKSPLALKLAYGVGSQADVSEQLGKELVRDGFATDVTPPKTKSTKTAKVEADTKANTKTKKRVTKTK